MRYVLLIIVFSQFLCTSLWFVGNSIAADIALELHQADRFLTQQTSIIQFGFIVGTFLFALLSISDRFSPSKVFFVSALAAGIINLGVSLQGVDANTLLMFRFMTGFFLAGIYPVGMKIASDYYQGGLGKSLGFLVGALVVGTALPHLLKEITLGFSWRYVIYVTSTLSVVGGYLIYFVPDGPFRRASQKIKLREFLVAFRYTDFRRVSFGYFGHMWELYTFWAFVPVMLTAYNNRFEEAKVAVPLFSFLIIAAGGIASAVSGFVAERVGVKQVAFGALLLSGLCCLVSPFFLLSSSATVFISFLFFWSMAVIADSPMFSTLVANYAPVHSRGTALTIVNCIGFAITIVSIQIIQILSASVSSTYLYMFLALGPAMGLLALVQSKK
jgi:MFS family permease